ncbi:MAG: ABC transporter permease [Lachnospiraceae bacterium]|nr:ABC transporter permease [Lachnospiraceae bacterium]
MKQFYALNTRNLKIYFKDISAVIFSFMSVLIVVMLMIFFLGNAANGSILSLVENIPGRNLAADAQSVKRIVFLWTVAGILTISSASITHAFYANMIKDRKDNRLNSILVMPVKRNMIVSSFVFGAWLTSVLMGALTLGVTELIGVAKGFPVFSVTEHLQILVLICVNSFVYASVLFLLANLVNSESAWSGIGIIVGTLSGFLGGIYMAVGNLSSGIVKVIKCFPFIYGTSAFRQVMLKTAEDGFFEGLPSEMRAAVDSNMGTSLSLFEKDLSLGVKIAILVVTGLVFCLASTIILKYGKKKDR